MLWKVIFKLKIDKIKSEKTNKIFSMSTCQKKTGSVVSLESMGSTSAMSQIMTCQELKYNGKPIYFIKSSVLIFSSPNISLAVGKEKALAMDADLFA